MGKKKGAGNKLARMSDEERARYLQHRAEIEEEARRRKQQLIAIFMKNKLKREEAFSRLNLAKINQEWRTILRTIKCQELKTEIKEVEQYFGDALIRKNQLVQRLLTDLDESEELYSTMSYAHMRNIEMLIKLHNDRISFWRIGYLNEKATLMSDFHCEMSMYKERKLGAFKQLKCVFYGLEDRTEKADAQADEEQLRKVDNVKSEMILQLQSITDEREHAMDRLWRQFQSVLTDYLQRTEEFHGEYMELRKKDDEDTQIIRFHYGEVLRCTDVIADLKHDMAKVREEHGVRVEGLKRYKRLLVDKLAERKTVLEESQLSEKERLRWMVVCSNEAITYLKNLLKKGETIKMIGAMCEQYETERDKCAPAIQDSERNCEIIKHELDESSKEAELLCGSKEDAKRKDIESETLNPLSVNYDMDAFWTRFNNARIDCACLSEEKSELKKQNRLLKEQLKTYLTNVTINDGSGGNAKDKLRPSSMRIERYGYADEFGGSDKCVDFHQKAQPRRRPVTCVEANFTPAVRSRSLVAASRSSKMPDVYALVNN